MEELHRIRPDAPFGWVLALQELIVAWRTRAARRRPKAGGLHNLATPR